MIASFGLGDADQIAAEEQFMYSLNRFQRHCVPGPGEVHRPHQPCVGRLSSAGPSRTRGIAPPQALCRRIPRSFRTA